MPDIHSLVFSIIIPVWKESDSFQLFLKELRRGLPPSGVEIIVVEADSGEHSGFPYLNMADKSIRATHPCRACQMHEGALAAKGNILMFLHADTKLPSDWQAILTDVWTGNDNLAMTAFRLSFDSSRFGYRVLAALANLRARWITGVPHGDQCLTVNRKTYLASGGFPHVPLMEEYLLCKKMKPFGKIRVLPSPVKTSPRRYEKNSLLLNAFRNLTLLILFYLGISPSRLAKFYR